MKNLLMIIISLAVGYGFAYMSASKKWAPFSKTGDQDALYSKTMVAGDNTSDSGKALAVEVTETEMRTMSDNYVAWITELKEKAAKGSKQKNEIAETVIRGGRISAALLDRLAKSNNDVYYMFGKKPNGNLTYMLLSDPEVASSSKVPGRYCFAADSATMCPCVCPLQAVPVLLPPYCLEPLPPLPPLPPPPGS